MKLKRIYNSFKVYFILEIKKLEEPNWYLKLIFLKNHLDFKEQKFPLYKFHLTKENDLLLNPPQPPGDRIGFKP